MNWTAEQEAIRDSFAAFARREVAPGAAERDRSGEFPAALVRRLPELDGMGISVAADDGGLGPDTVSQLLTIEQVAYADAALASIYTAHYLGMEVFRVRAAAPQRKSGLRSSPTHTVYLDDVRLPADALLGDVGAGGTTALEVLNAARIDIAAMANGIAARA